MMGVASNGGEFFRFNDAGELEIAVNSDAALEGLAWAKDIWAKYGYQQPADGSWDYFKDSWKQGLCGFYMYQTYGDFNDNSEMADMEDEWGCVAFPKGPKGETYVNITSDNVTVIPNVYDAETAGKLAFIYDMWSNATLYIGSVNDVLGSPLLWQLGGAPPAELVEAATPAWQALCDAFNGK